MKKFLLSLLLIIVGATPVAADVTAYKDNKGNIYFEGLPRQQQRLSIYYYDGSIKYQGVYMSREGRDRISCDLHVIWSSSKSKFRLTEDLTILGAPGGDLQFNYRPIGLPWWRSIPWEPNIDPCNLPASSWMTIRPGIEMARGYNNRWSFKYYPREGENAGTLTTGYKATYTIYFRGLPGSVYRVINSSQKSRFLKSNACGFAKIASTDKWTADLTDYFSLYNDSEGERVGRYTRAELSIKPFAQIPKCFDGKKFVYQP